MRFSLHFETREVHTGDFPKTVFYGSLRDTRNRYFFETTAPSEVERDRQFYTNFFALFDHVGIRADRAWTPETYAIRVNIGSSIVEDFTNDYIPTVIDYLSHIIEAGVLDSYILGYEEAKMPGAPRLHSKKPREKDLRPPL